MSGHDRSLGPKWSALGSEVERTNMGGLGPLMSTSGAPLGMEATGELWIPFLPQSCYITDTSPDDYSGVLLLTIPMAANVQRPRAI